MDGERTSSPSEGNLSQELDDILVDTAQSPERVEEPLVSQQERDSSSEDIILVSISHEQNLAEINPESIPPFKDLSPGLNQEENDLNSPKEDSIPPIEATSSQECISPENVPSEPPDLPGGKLVWAKLSGFRFWPGLLVDIESDGNLPSKLKTPYREGWLLVHFFGTYDYAWVPPKSCIVSWETGKKKNYPSKCKSKFFQLALTEADEFIEKGGFPKGFEVIPEVLGSGSDSDSSHAGVKIGMRTSRGKITTRASSKRAHSLTSASDAIVSIKKMKLPDTPSPSSSKGDTLQSMGEGRKRCTLIMKKLGLTPPDPYLGRKFPERIETDSDSKSLC